MKLKGDKWLKIGDVSPPKNTPPPFFFCFFFLLKFSFIYNNYDHLRSLTHSLASRQLTSCHVEVFPPPPPPPPESAKRKGPRMEGILEKGPQSQSVETRSRAAGSVN